MGMAKLRKTQWWFIQTLGGLFGGQIGFGSIDE
jgi:hypothetical protein